MQDSPFTIVEMIWPFYSWLFAPAAVVVLIILLLRLIVAAQNASKALRIRRRQFAQAKLRRAIAREEGYRQQLRKTSFQDRLSRFADGCVQDRTSPSRMPYWQADDLEIRIIPPRPIEFFRVALIRLSKRLRCGK